MTFNELPLFEAVHDVYRTVDNPRSERWLYDAREELCRRIQRALPLDSPFGSVQMLEAWTQYGKSQLIGDSGIKRIELIVTVARVHGRTCFYARRGKGDCTNEVNLDRIMPGARGGEYTLENCMIACSVHNIKRSDRSIEEYLAEAIEQACMPRHTQPRQESDR